MNFKRSLVVVIVLGIVGLLSFVTDTFSSEDPQPAVGSIYDFKIKSLDGKEIDFTQYKGHQLLIVNTASKCGKTPQYAGLEKLHEQYGDKITVLGFPANNFLWQEPGSNEDIAAFCQRNYGVKFQLFGKISVKGKDAHPLYKWLRAKTGHKPDWNFAKYLVSSDGDQVTFFNSSVQPLDQQILSKIEP
ncbi:MAG: glutathione peroxidase [Cytophagales bacterium]|nr:glutathione peroxidase [Bacteroidota bacterium]MBS1980165.1 glutathione peroxidase [Bacteroidota bacterium]WHZ08676.1 MAG: glutathione peroxidase [Cytophagales bacterium]